MSSVLRDSYNRPIRDLRISLTDRCNFRCFYCLPHGEPPLARKETILTFEEIAALSEIFVSLGIEKIRLTGGEPLLRKDVEQLIKKLAVLKAKPSGQPESRDLDFKSQTAGEISDLKSQKDARSDELRAKSQKSKTKDAGSGLKDLALTTNGYSLTQRARELKEAGLDRVTISLDSLSRDNFRKITGVDRLAEVLAAIEAAKAAGLEPVKINAVIVRGWNEGEVVELARFARERQLSMRFIEFMPLDSGHEWDRNLVVPGREIRRQIEEVFPLVLKDPSRGSETAWKFAFADGAPGEIGIIAPVTEMFCGQCSRIRLTADGQIRTCLFSTREYNLRDLWRSGATREEIVEFIRDVVWRKEPRHFINDRNFAPASRSMSFIGG